MQRPDGPDRELFERITGGLGVSFADWASMTRSQVSALYPRLDPGSASELRKLRRRMKNRSSQAKSSHTRRAREVIFMEENERLKKEIAAANRERTKLRREKGELETRVEKLELTISLMSELDEAPAIDLDLFGFDCDKSQ